MTSNTPDATSTGTQITIPPTKTIFPSATQSSAPTVTNTATETSQPTVTASPTETPSLTPLPTLPAEGAMDLVVGLLQNNAGCQLPCYWGFTPGITIWDETSQFLASIAYRHSTHTRVKDKIIGEVSFSVPEEIDPYLFLRQAYTIGNNGVIEQIEVHTGTILTYTLSTFLTTYGPPSEIWTNPDAELILSSYLFYPQQGVLAIFTHRSLSLTDTDIVICPQNEADPLLVLWAPEVEKSFLDDILNHTALLGGTDTSLFHKIEEVTDIDKVTFFEAYSDPNTDLCYRVPREKWPDLRIVP